MTKYNKHVVCPYCGNIDNEKTFWVTEMLFDSYKLQCGKCNKEFGCTTNDEKLSIYKLEDDIELEIEDDEDDSLFDEEVCDEADSYWRFPKPE